MTAWLLGILGVGVLDIVVLHFTESSRLHKTIKTVCSVIFILVVIHPLPGLISGNIEFDAIIFNYSIEMDSTMTDIVYESERKLLENAVNSALRDEGYNATVKISAEFEGGNIVITRVTVTADAYNGQIADRISEYLDIGKEYIYIDVKA